MTPKKLGPFQQFRQDNPDLAHLDNTAIMGIVAQKTGKPFSEISDKLNPKDPLEAFRLHNPSLSNKTDDELYALIAKKTGKPLHEVSAKLNTVRFASPIKPEVKASDLTFGDFLKTTGIGVGDALSGLGYLVEKTGADKIGKQFRETGARYKAGFESRMTEAGKKALNSSIFEDDPTSLVGAKLSKDATGALLATSGRSLPSMIAGIVPGLAGTAAIQYAAKGLASLGIGGSTLSLLSGSASGVTTGAKLTAAIPTAVGFGAGEGVVAGSINADSFEQSLLKLPKEEWSKSPVYNKLAQEVGPEEAIKRIAKDAANEVFVKTGLATGAIGAVTGGGALGALARQTKGITPSPGLVPTVVKGAGTEAVQEAPQSGVEEYLTNLTEKKFVDPSIDPIRGVTAATLSGAAAGGLTGGAISVPGALLNIKRKDRDAQPTIAQLNTLAQEATTQAPDIAKQASDINTKNIIDKTAGIAATKSVDDAIAAAKNVVSGKPVTPGDIFDTKAGSDALLNAITTRTINLPIEGATNAATQTKQTETSSGKTASENTLSTIEQRVNKFYRLNEQALARRYAQRASGEPLPDTEQAISVLERRKSILERQISEEAWLPRTKLEELNTLISGQEARKSENPDTWGSRDENVLQIAYARRQDLTDIETLANELQIEPRTPPVAATESVFADTTDANSLAVEMARTDIGNRMPVSSRIANRYTPSQLVDRIANPTATDGQFVKDIVHLMRNPRTGELPTITEQGLVDLIRNVKGDTPVNFNTVLGKLSRARESGAIDAYLNDLNARVESIRGQLSNRDSVYSNDQISLRPDITGEAMKASDNVYNTTIRRAAERLGATPTAIRIAQNFKESGTDTLVGKKVNNANDLAELAQVLRDPRMETLRVFLVNDNNTIVNHFAMSSRLAGSVQFNRDDVLDAVKDYKLKDQSVTGYYLLHNHPTGDPTPSNQDVEATKNIGGDVSGLLGHIVIDSDSYSVIDPLGDVEAKSLDIAAAEQYSLDNWAVNLKMENADDLANLAKGMQQKTGFFTLIGLDTNNRVTAIMDVPESAVSMDEKRLAANLRQIARGSGTDRMFAVINPGSELSVSPRMRSAVESGVLMGVLDSRAGQTVIAPTKPEYVSIFKAVTKNNIPLAKIRDKSGLLKSSNVVGGAAVATPQQPLPPGTPPPVINPTKAPKPNIPMGPNLTAEKAKAELASRNLGTQAERIEQANPPKPAEPLPESTRLDKFRELYQDNMIRIKTLQNWIKKQGIEISEWADIYTRENLSKAKTANKMEDFRRDIVAPLVKDAGKAGISIGELAEYLEMRHVPEANAYMRFIHNDASATANGITDTEASSVVKSYESRKDFAKFKALADRMRSIGNMTLDMRVQEGLISTDQAQAYKQRYKEWVPLRGKELRRSVKDKRRFGHDTREEYVFENLILGHEVAIMQVEQNKLAKSVAQFLIEADNPAIGTISAPRRMLTLDSEAYVVSYKDKDITSFRSMQQAQEFIADLKDPGAYTISKTTDPQIVMRNRPFAQENEIMLYLNGHEIRMQIHDKEAAAALKKVGLEALGGIAGMARGFMTYLSKSYTAWSPDFTFTNIVRDLGGGTFVLTGQKGAAFTAKVLKNYPTVFPELFKYQKDPKSSKLVDDYRQDGGNTGAAWIEDMDRVGRDVVLNALESMSATQAYNMAYSSIYDDYITNGKKINHKVIALRAASATGYTRLTKIPVIGHFLRFMEAINGIAENAMRLATYKTMLEEGHSRQDAAFMAKNLLNFNRKGNIANKMGVAYIFFNPGMQGLHIFGQAFTQSPHRNQVWMLASTMAITSYLVAEAMRNGSDDDERKWKNTPSYVKERNLVINIGGYQATIPVSYGFGIFHQIGNILSDISHGKSLTDAAWEMASALFTHFFIFGNPIVETKGEYEVRPSMVLPTMAKMVLGPEANIDGLGRPIYPVTFSDSIPDSQRMTRGVRNTWYESTSSFLNDISGGEDKYTKGVIDISPNVIKYWVESLTGGWGRFASDTGQILYNAPQGVTPELQNIPVVRKLVRSPEAVSDTRGGFWSEANNVKREYEQFRRALKDNADFATTKTLDERNDLIHLFKLQEKQGKLAARMRDEILRVQADKNLSAKARDIKIRQLEKQEDEAYKVFLRDFDLRRIK